MTISQNSLIAGTLWSRAHHPSDMENISQMPPTSYQLAVMGADILMELFECKVGQFPRKMLKSVLSATKDIASRTPYH